LLADSRLFVFGGFNGHDVWDDVHILDLAGNAYLAQVTSFSIGSGQEAEEDEDYYNDSITLGDA
jgi:hypothetical protein